MFKKRNLIILCTLTLLIGSILGYQAWKRGELKRNGKLIIGWVISERMGTKSQWWFNYEFDYKGKVYKQVTSVDVRQLQRFIGKSFPVIFSPPSGRSEMLITPRDFEIYDLPYPDSLNWVRGLVDKNKYRF